MLILNDFRHGIVFFLWLSLDLLQFSWLTACAALKCFAVGEASPNSTPRSYKDQCCDDPIDPSPRHLFVRVFLFLITSASAELKKSNTHEYFL